jgi:hypothetical protein
MTVKRQFPQPGRPNLSDLEPIVFPGGGRAAKSPGTKVTFDRRELLRILDLYGRKVAAGEWRDYAISFLKDRAVFAVFRRSSELPLYRIEKNASLTRKQGAYAVVAAGGFILKRGHDLDRVLRVLEPLRAVN